MANITGGLRDRMIEEALVNHVRAGLTALGWFAPGRAHQTITLRQAKVEADEQIPVNTLNILAEDFDDFAIEMGSNMSEDRHMFYIDFYAENDALGKHVIGDVRDLLRGKMPGVSEHSVVRVFDYQLDPVPADPEFVVDVENVLIDHARETTRPFEQHWWMCRVELVDER